MKYTREKFEQGADEQQLQWDHCLSTLLIRSTIGAGFGVIFSVLLFKRRAFPVWLGTGFGAGRAWEECDSVCWSPEASRGKPSSAKPAPANRRALRAAGVRA